MLRVSGALQTGVSPGVHGWQGLVGLEYVGHSEIRADKDLKQGSLGGGCRLGLGFQSE